MSIINKLGFKKYIIIAYILSIITIVFYLALFFSNSFLLFIKNKTIVFFNEIHFLDLRLSLFLFALIIICIVFIIFSLIKCPRCGNKFFWHWFNDDKRKKGGNYNPFVISVCPNCNYDPDKNSLKKDKAL